MAAVSPKSAGGAGAGGGGGVAAAGGGGAVGASASGVAGGSACASAAGVAGTPASGDGIVDRPSASPAASAPGSGAGAVRRAAPAPSPAARRGARVRLGRPLRGPPAALGGRGGGALRGIGRGRPVGRRIRAGRLRRRARALRLPGLCLVGGRRLRRSGFGRLRRRTGRRIVRICGQRLRDRFVALALAFAFAVSGGGRRLVLVDPGVVILLERRPAASLSAFGASGRRAAGILLGAHVGGRARLHGRDVQRRRPAEVLAALLAEVAAGGVAQPAVATRCLQLAHAPSSPPASGGWSPNGGRSSGGVTPSSPADARGTSGSVRTLSPRLTRSL